MGSKIKPITEKIITLSKAGMCKEDIAQEVQGTYAQVAASIARAQRRGDLPPNKPVPITDIASFRRRYDIKTGSVGSSLVENATKEVWDFAADQMLRNDYPSLADYLVDLLIDEFYKQEFTGDRECG